MKARRIVLAVVSLAVLFGVCAVSTPAAPKNCSIVRCATCPDGYHLSLKWPNCCACLPNS